jgi:iron complex transport system permease protein
MTSLRQRLMLTTIVFGAVAVAAVLLAPLVGSTRISMARAFDRSIAFTDNPDAQIFFVARMPRVLAGVVVGAALATAGTVLQALFRNPLAAPETMGVSAGASLGATLAIFFDVSTPFGPYSAVALASLCGALGATAVVYLLASAPRRPMSTAVLLLAGVSLNAFISGLIVFVQYMSDYTQTFRVMRWLVGDLDVGSFGPVWSAASLLAVVLALVAPLASTLNVLTLGTTAAATRGVNVDRAQRLAFFTASLATSTAVSLAGPVAFIGIVVPHLVRLMVGVDHRVVLPAAALFGAAFLIVCDLIARTIIAPVELPVGIITAVIGGPFFLWLLVRKSSLRS